MNTPANRHQPNNSPKPRRKNNPILIAILLLMVTALALSALSSRGGRVPSPSRSAGNASLPATPRSAGRQAAAQQVFADPTVAATRSAKAPASPAVGRDRSETRPLTDTGVSLDKEANLEVERSSTAPVPMRAPRVPMTAMIPGLSRNNGDLEQEGRNQQDSLSPNRRDDNSKSRRPREERLIKAHSFKGDLRKLPYRRPVARRERRELEEPE